MSGSLGITRIGFLDGTLFLALALATLHTRWIDLATTRFLCMRLSLRLVEEYQKLPTYNEHLDAITM